MRPPMASRLNLPQALLEQIDEHALAEYPDECCGLLLGRSTDGGNEVVRLHPVDNQRQDAAHHRYLIAPEDYLRAERQAFQLGIDLVGVYHSHPDHPAFPSETDLVQAWPNLAYLIVSVLKGAVEQRRSFQLREDRQQFDEQPIVVTPSAVDGGL